MNKPKTVSTYPWHRPCPICDTNSTQLIFDNFMAPLDGLDMGYRVSKCGHCGFHFASDLPYPDTYGAYYRVLSKYDVIIDGTAISSVAATRIQRALELCAPYLPAEALIADIGCGYGALLNGFRTAGFSRLYGIDPAPYAAREAARLFGLDNIHIGTLPNAPRQLPLDKADLLCLTGVAEHLPKLADDFAILLYHLPAHAMVLVEVPTLEHFHSLPCEPYGEFSLEHIQYFDTCSLQDLMAKFGFFPHEISILQCQGCTDSLFGLFSREAYARTNTPPMDIKAYLAHSATTLNQALLKITQAVQQPFIVFGAGSHTARLLPHLERLNLDSNILAIVDNNPNLKGKKLGNFNIQERNFLENHPGKPVLVSSFHAQNAIAHQLFGHHPIILLYDS